MVGASAMGPEPFAITPRDDETEEEARERILKRFEKIGLQIVNRTSGGGPFGENPIASVMSDSRQARDRRSDRRTGVRRRLQPDRREPRGRRAHRRHSRRPARALRRRAPEPARRVEAHDPRRRPVGGELVADDVMDKAAADAKPVPTNTGGTAVVEHPGVACRPRAALRLPKPLCGVLRPARDRSPELAWARCSSSSVAGAPPLLPPGRRGSRPEPPSNAPRRSQST